MTGGALVDSRSRRVAIVALAAAGIAAFGVTASSGGLGPTLTRGIAGLGGADRRWLVAALLGFLVSVVATAVGWRSTLTACGARLGWVDACARYGAGSLTNTFLPARLGEAVRVGLFSKAFGRDQEGRTLMAVGALGAVTAADSLTQSLVVGAGAVVGPVPAWALAVLGGTVFCGAGAAIVAARRCRTGRLARVLAAFRALSDSPGRTARLLGWLGLATAARLAAAIAVAASLGIPGPVEAGVVICAIVIVATALPVMPGNVGVTSGAIVLALHAQGVPVVSAVAVGLAFHAVELFAGIVFGIGASLVLVPYPSAALRRWSLRFGGLVCAGSLAAGVATAFVPQLT